MNVVEQKMERRRGAALEAAILDAACEELFEGGYAAFTIEAVVKRAETSRSVIYRRWTDRAELAVAAIRHFIAERPVHTEDLGNLRDELISLLRQYAQRAASLTILFSLREYFKETNSMPLNLREKVLSAEEDTLQAAMLRAVARGEIDARKLTPRIILLPSDLLRHQSMMTLKPPTDEDIAEIIDTIFLPLVSK